MPSAAKFAASLVAHGKAVEQGLAQAVNTYSVQHYTALVNAKHTGANNQDPILTGYSRSRWRLKFGGVGLPDVDPPPRDATKRYPRPVLTRTKSKVLQSTVITNDASYINEIDRAHLITLQAEFVTDGLLDTLIKRYVPR